MTEPTQAAQGANTQAAGGQQVDAQTQQAQGQQAKTFTQEELDRIIGERLKREESKYADYAELKKFKDEAEAKSKSELEKLTDAKAKAEAEAKRIQEQSLARVLTSEARAIAAELGFTKPEKAIKLADLSKAVKDGEVDSAAVKEALTVLAKEMPELLKAEKTAPGSPTNPQKGGAAGETDEQKRARLRGSGGFDDWMKSGEVQYYPKPG